MNKTNLSKGSSLIEVMIGLSIVFVCLISLITAYHFFLNVSIKNTQSIKASFLLEEGAEAVRLVRDSGWTNISTLQNETDYYLNFGGGAWSLVATPTTTDNFFERKIVLSEVFRDSFDDIAETGYLDEGTRKANVSVSWLSKGATTTVSTDLILANLFENGE